MGIWNINRIHIQHLFRTSLLVNERFLVSRYGFTVVTVMRRYAHNNLFQMVKKRTLEARAKSQANKYPNNKPILKGEQAAATSAPSSQAYSSDQNYPEKIRNSSSDYSKSSGRNKASLNVDVLKASKCPDSAESGIIGRFQSRDRMTPPKPTERVKSPRTDLPSCSSNKSSISNDKVNVVDGRGDSGGSAVCSVKDRPMVKGPPSGGGWSSLDCPDKREIDPCGGKSDSSTSGSDTESSDGSSSGRDVCGIGGSSYGGSGGSGTGGGGGAGGGSGGLGGNEGLQSNKLKIYALLAALGLGGLFWLLSGSLSKTENEDELCIDEEVEEKKKVPCSDPAISRKKIKSSDLPKHVPYLLIGGGTAAFSAFRAIKSNDPLAKVLILTDEYLKPYMRPPLSKELWYHAQKDVETSKDIRFKQWTGAERSLFFEPDEFFIHPTKLLESANGGIAVAHGHKVKKIDPVKHIVTLEDNYEISYQECLIATGCTPKTLPVFRDAPTSVREKIMVYRTPDDFEKLKRIMDSGKNITIIGNGFVGSELACSLANYKTRRESKIFQVFPEAGIMSKVLPDYLSKWTMHKVRGQGVCVFSNASVLDVRRDNSRLQLALSTGEILLTDIVVVCVGCEANTNIATLSGLEVDRQLGGFVVNAELEARRNLFVAGDASCFYDPLLGRRRVEHHDHSVVSGRLAGENMVGKKKPYNHQSMFWSDLGPELGYEGIGLVDASLPTVAVFALPDKNIIKSDNLTDENREKVQSLDSNKVLPSVECNEEEDCNYYGRGVIFYLKDKKVVGILLWNLFNRIGLARTIINQDTKYEDLNEVAKIFEIHT